MDSRRLLLTVWNWLPAFQVVAETEHLPTASGRLRVTASALSRSITMLEDRLGRPLFTRQGRQLVLNADGRRLLAGMTTAVGVLDEVVATLSGAGLDGPLYASATGPFAQLLVLPALRDLQTRGQGLVPYVYGYDHDEAVRLLQAGKLDVIFDSTPSSGADVVTTSLGETANGIYCGREHPLFSGSDTEARDVLSHGFVVTCAAGGDRPTDAFPLETPRRIEMYVHQMSVALEACLAGHLLAVLPEFATRTLVREGELRQVAFGGLPPTALYATYARAHANDERVRAVVAAVAEARAAAIEADLEIAASSRRQIARLPERTAVDHDDWLAGGDALFARGENRAARVAYDEALRVRRIGNGNSTVDGAHHAGRVARLLVSEGKYDDAQRRCEQALVELAGTDALAAALLEATAALACCFRGEEARAREGLDRARVFSSAERARDGRATHRLWALVQRTEGNILVALGRYSDAIAAYSQGADAAAASGDAWEHSIALFNLAEAHAMLGHLDHVSELLDAATREKEQVGDRWGLAHIHHLRARLELDSHHADIALEELRGALRFSAGLDDPKLVSACNTTLGDVLLARGERDEARRAFDLARTDAERCGARTETVRALVGLSAVDLERGKHTAARRSAERALELARQGNARFVEARALIALADIASAEQKHAEASALYREALIDKPQHGRLL